MSEQHERARHLMMAALDEELTTAERAELDRLLSADSELRDEWERMRKVKEVTGTMRYRKPAEEVWDTYWVSVYNRTERGLGWILLSVGLLVLYGYGSWQWINALLSDESIPGFVRFALFAVMFGGAILLVSVIREKWFTGRKDPYKEVQR